MKANIKRIFFPERCVICERLLDKKENGFCLECKSIIKVIGPRGCIVCGKLIEKNKYYCKECQSLARYIDRNISFYEYGSKMRESLYRFKYKNKRDYSKGYIAGASYYYEIIRNWKAEAIIPIPVHNNKKRLRGYNQAEVFGKELGKALNIKVDNEILIRTSFTTPQKELNRHQRFENLKKAFGVDRKRAMVYNCVVLVDDIYTTGSTLDICALMLKKCGVKKVYGICIASGRD